MPRPRSAAATVRTSGAKASPAPPPPSQATMEEVKELKEFLKVVHPAWSLVTPNGGHPIDRVIAKLRDIGIFNIDGLMARLSAGSLNYELAVAGHSCFEQSTLAELRAGMVFQRCRPHLKEPFYRQTGIFAHVPAMMQKTFSRTWDTLGSGAEQQRPQRPATAPSGVNASASKGPRQPRRPDTAPCGKAAATGSSAVLVKPKLRYVERRRAKSVSGSRTDPIVEEVKEGEREAVPQLQKSPVRRCMSDIVCNNEQSQEARKSLRRTNSAVLSEEPQRYQDTVQNALQKSEAAAVTLREALAMETQVEQLQKIGTQMASEPKVATWTNLHSQNLYQRAELAVKESLALDEKVNFLKSMAREGQQSSTRQVIAGNIESRLRAAADKKMSADLYTQCVTITKNLASMQDARRELQQVRRNASALLGDDGQDALSALRLLKKTTGADTP